MTFDKANHVSVQYLDPHIFQANVIVVVRVILSVAIGDNNLHLAKYAS